RVDVANSFNGNQSVTGNMSISGNSTFGGYVSIGSGTAITKHLSSLFDLPVPLLKPGTCANFARLLPGASDGDTVSLGVPSARMRQDTGVILNYFAWASGVNLVSIQACNLGSSPQKTLGTGAFRVDLWKH